MDWNLSGLQICHSLQEPFSCSLPGVGVCSKHNKMIPGQKLEISFLNSDGEFIWEGQVAS